MNIKANRHYRQTHTNICQTLVTLLAEKDIKNITVSEICRILQINRGTFYDHFTDIYDVMEKIEQEMAEEIGRRFKQGLQISQKNAFMEMFQYIKENQSFYRFYLEQNYSKHQARKISLEEIQNFHAPLKHSITSLSEVEIFYYVEFFRSGIRALLRCWLNRNCAESPEKLFDILLQHYRNVVIEF